MKQYDYRRGTYSYALRVPNANTAQGFIDVDIQIEPYVHNNWEFVVQVEKVSLLHQLLNACAQELGTLNLISPTPEKTALLQYLRTIGDEAHGRQKSFMRSNTSARHTGYY